MSNTHKYDDNINILEKILTLISTKKFKNKMGKILIHFPLENIDQISHIKIDDKNEFTIIANTGKVIITNSDIICYRNEDEKLKRDPIYLLTKIKSGHDEQSCFLLNDDVTFEIYKNKIRNKIQELINLLKIGKENNNDYINHVTYVKNITPVLNDKRKKFIEAYSINIKPYEVGSFSFIKRKENKTLNIKIANCHIIALDNTDEISILSNYYDYYNEDYMKINKAIEIFNKNKTINRGNIFTVIQNYMPKLFEQSHPIITLNGNFKSETITEIDQERKQSIVDISNLITGYKISVNGNQISSIESYQGSLKVPTNVNLNG